MKLLTFAHRGEAQAFIDALDVKAISSTLFQSECELILITGEGSFEALNAISYALGKYPQISSIYNYGIAGNLSSKIQNEVISIRTIYSHNSADILFKSFTTSDCNAKADLLSFDKRLKDSSTKEKLSVFASLVDREAWAVGFSASKLKLPFFVYKLITDDADENTQCELIKDDALKFSMKLLAHYQSLKFETQGPSIELPEGLYFTHQQKILFSNYNDKLKLLEIDYSQCIAQARELDISLKKKSSVLLSKMRELISPLNSMINEKINKELSPLIKAGAIPTLDKQLESSNFSFKYQIKDEKDLIRLKKSLDIFSYQKFNQIFDGDFDV